MQSTDAFLGDRTHRAWRMDTICMVKGSVCKCRGLKKHSSNAVTWLVQNKWLTS